jgi:hypothetical protein
MDWQKGRGVIPYDWLSQHFGKRCVGISLPPVDAERRQWLHLDFADGSRLSGCGSDVAAALANALARAQGWLC